MFRFTECSTCSLQPGTPQLCQGCLNNRETIAMANACLLERRDGIYARLEPKVSDIPIAHSPFQASAAFSLKRIADNLEPVRPRQIALYVRSGGTHIFQQVNSSDSRNVYRGTFGEIILQDYPAS